MSLLKDIEDDLQKKYPQISNTSNTFIQRINRAISNANFWQVFITFIILIFLSILYSHFLNFEFLKVLKINFIDNAKIFTTGIITLVSINLFVTNFLFTHLKEERDDLQSIIDEKVNFKFITYLGFTLIVCILLLYFLAPTVQNEDIKSNILIIIFFSFLFYIFQLIFLYNKVFSFIHKGKRKKIIEDALDREFANAFKNNYLKNEFKKRYQNEMENNLEFSRYSSINPEFESDVKYLSIEKKKTVYLKDIKLKNLKYHLKDNNSKEKLFSVLELDQRFSKEKPHTLLVLTNPPNKKVLNYFSFSSKQNILRNYSQTQLNNLIQKVETNTVKNNYFELTNNLDDLERVYDLYLDL